jgi:indole-3-glycerol phosphate synthase
MVQSVPDILARIADHKRAELPSRRNRRDEYEQRAHTARVDRRDFAGALRTAPAIIAEIKKASPSKGVLAADFNPPSAARAYQNGGAAALSVLTDSAFFQGSLGDMENARSAVRLPVLRKDFTIDELDVIEAAAHRADAILLIAAILSVEEIRRFRELAGSFGMAAIVEVHDQDELRRAVDAGASIIGVNNRDLRTFEVRLETSLTLAEQIPADAIKVSESGIHSAGDVRKLRAAGFDAFLVGEHLMKSPDPERAVRALLE